MIANSLSKQFPQIGLEKGRMRAGLELGLRTSEYRDSFWFQTKGEDSFMSGSASHDRANAPTRDGWRRDFDFAVVDRDDRQGAHDLKVKVRDSHLLVTNGEATLNIDIGGHVADRDLAEGARLVTVQSDVKRDETRTRVSVGHYANDVTTFELRNGTLVAL